MNNDFFDELEEQGIKINEEQKKEIKRRINNVLNYEPKIGIFGKTGVGKSSLCNALFGKDVCPISDVEACTRDMQEVLLSMGQKGMKLIDVPGVGESTERDTEYAELYAKLLPELDLVLWLIKADDRAHASDETFYKNIVRPHEEEGKPFLFVLNQVDKIEPFREWDEKNNEPGPKQFQNIHRKVDNVASFFGVAPSKVIPVSANEKYNLTKLVDEIVHILPKEKLITVAKEIPKEFISDTSGEKIKKSFLEVVGETVSNVVDKVGDVVISTVETVGRVAEKVIDKVAKKADDFFGNLPIIGSHGGGCYITTATCKQFGKADDCYELTKFREFRDKWLIKQPDGRALINEYYRTAPKMVELIESKPNKEEIYKHISEKYLKPCLNYIEKNDNEACKNLYIKMVRNIDEGNIDGFNSTYKL